MCRGGTMDLGLTDRVAIVTASSRGVGRAAALLFGRERARVAVTFFRQREKAEAVVQEIGRSGADACAVELDLTSIESIHCGGRCCGEALGPHRCAGQ